jgi:hypothetical protein
MSVDSNLNQSAIPPIIECPVYVYGGSYCVEVEIQPSTEGVVLFSQRCIDGWLQTGGVANNPILRFHDFSDACFFPGIRSNPNAISGHSNNGIKLRNDTGSQYVWLKNDGTAEIQATSVTINGNVTVNGNTTTTGNADVTGNVQAVGRVTAPEIDAQISLRVTNREVGIHTHLDSQGKPTSPMI